MDTLFLNPQTWDLAVTAAGDIAVAPMAQAPLGDVLATDLPSPDPVEPIR